MKIAVPLSVMTGIQRPMKKGAQGLAPYPIRGTMPMPMETNKPVVPIANSKQVGGDLFMVTSAGSVTNGHSLLSKICGHSLR